MEREIAQLLSQWGQSHLLAGIENLTPLEIQSFADQLGSYDTSLLERQRKRFHEVGHESGELLSYESRFQSGNGADRERGQTLIAQGKAGCLILAGGQATRLGFAGPKGTFPVSPVTGKSLFQLFSERVHAASVWAGRKLPLCVMTSPLNHAQTVAFFQANDFFGLDPSQLSFFQQGMLPFLDDQGNWVLEKPGKIAEGPDGNGHALRLFFETGLWKQWKEAGVEFLNVIVVDNPLADPFDPEFIGFTARTGVDVALKAVKRLSSDEQMGVLAEQNGKLKVVEYSEISSGSLPFTLSHTGLFCFSMEWIGCLYQCGSVDSPLHFARKSAKLFGSDLLIWKSERFLFDLLDHARTSGVLVCPREETYAPLKNAAGDRSVETVKEALTSYYRQVYRAATGELPPAAEFELDPALHWLL